MDRLCCCDDQGGAGCVVSLATVSGEASGVDVMHREVQRDAAGRRPGDTSRTSAAVCFDH